MEQFLTFKIKKNLRFCCYIDAGMSQVVKYSEDYDQLFDDFETAPTANIVYGSLENLEPGSSVFLYVSAPYNEGKNVYFVVVNTGKDNTKVCMH